MIPINPYSFSVQLADGTQVPLLAKDIAVWFCDAQPADGALEPWQVEEIAEALIRHLQEDAEQDVIPLDGFASLVSQLIIVCGLKSALPTVSVPVANLYRLAQDTGCGFELAFFQSVKRSIQEFREGKIRVIRFVGLRACVKLLAGARNWGKTCQQLNDEIVAFIRSQIQQWAAAGPVLCVVAS